LSEPYERPYRYEGPVYAEEPAHAEEPAYTEEPISSERSSGRGRLVLTHVILALISSGAAFGWHYRDGLIPSSTMPEVAAVTAVDQEVNSSLKDLRTSQLQTAGQISQLSQAIAATQTDVKKLADQLASLSARLDALQNAQAAPPHPAVVHPTVPAQEQVAPGKKYPQPQKPTAPSSVKGGPMKLVPN
jgi:uncharacterized coiled-coil protein SlyX